MGAQWYAASLSKQLRPGQVAEVSLLGTPLCLFRAADGRPGALLDRCPHRNTPLSRGKVVGLNLACSYHGWEFDPEGACRHIPGLCGEFDPTHRGVTSYPVREQDGFVWVWMAPDQPPDREPFRFPHLDDPRYTHVWEEQVAEGTLYSTLENALDVPHTAFLHKGLFRGRGAPSQIEARLRRFGDRVEVEYLGEPPPKGLAARILGMGGSAATTRHVDRFFLPSIAQVEYALGERSHFVVTSAGTPVNDFTTRLFAVVSFRTPLPGALVRFLLRPFARRIFAQDASVLRLQTQTIQRFGGEQFASTDLDIIGPHIWRLMKDAAAGAQGRAEVLELERTTHLRA
jgi:phenylpropionate dioxygenase-like ring-hydroxylating dioxygenase large terminal subunit